MEEWSTEFDYYKYFVACGVQSCTYTNDLQTSYIYAITLFLSLYGGLIIVLRLIAAFLVNLSLRIKHDADSINSGRGTFHVFLIASIFSFSVLNSRNIQRLRTWIMQMNLFEAAENRTSEDIKQQRITTRLYLALLLGTNVLFDDDFSAIAFWCGVSDLYFV